MLMDQNIDKKIYDVGWEVINSSQFNNLKILRNNIYKIITEEFNYNEQIFPDIADNDLVPVASGTGFLISKNLIKSITATWILLRINSFVINFGTLAIGT